MINKSPVIFLSKGEKSPKRIRTHFILVLSTPPHEEKKKPFEKKQAKSLDYEINLMKSKIRSPHLLDKKYMLLIYIRYLFDLTFSTPHTQTHNLFSFHDRIPKYNWHPHTF